MFIAECHCGNVRLTANHMPSTVTCCNCSICRKYGVRWAYYIEKEIIITHQNTTPSVYSWAEKTIDFFHCVNCACVTHYAALNKDGSLRIAINTNMVDPDITKSIPIRFFDGADTFKYID